MPKSGGFVVCLVRAFHLVGTLAGCATESEKPDKPTIAPSKLESIEANVVKLSQSCQDLASTLWQLEVLPLQERWTSDYAGRTFEWGNWTIRQLDRDKRILRASGGCPLDLVLTYDATATPFLGQIDDRRATRSFTLKGTLGESPTFVRGQAGEIHARGLIGELPPPEVAQGLTITRACTLAPYEMTMGTWKNLGGFEEEPWACVGQDVDMNTGRQAGLSSGNSLSFQVTGSENAPKSLRLKLFAQHPTSDLLRQFATKAGELTLSATGQSMSRALQLQLIEAHPGRTGLDGFSATIARDDHVNERGFTLRYILAVNDASRKAQGAAAIRTKPLAAQPRARRKVSERLELPCRPGQAPPCYD